MISAAVNIDGDCHEAYLRIPADGNLPFSFWPGAALLNYQEELSERLQCAKAIAPHLTVSAGLTSRFDAL